MTFSCTRLRGEFSKRITVRTNDPSNPTVALHCNGRLLETFRAKPSKVDFINISRKGSPETRKLILTQGDGGPLKLKLLPIETKGIEASLREITPGNRYELTVTATPPYDFTQLRSNLKLETGIADSPTTPIALYVRFRPRVAASPRRVTVPKMRDRNWTQEIELVWDDDDDHRILGAEVNDHRLRVRLKDKGGKQVVALSIAVGMEPQVRIPSISIITDDSEIKTVRVPVSLESWRGSAGQERSTAPRRFTKRAKPLKGKPDAGKKEPGETEPEGAKPSGSSSD